MAPSCNYRRVEQAPTVFDAAWRYSLLDAADLEQLKALVVDQLMAGSPPTADPAAPAPVVRRWEPGATSTDCGARIVAARRELGFSELSELPTPRLHRSARKGWRGRTYSFKAREIVHWSGRLVLDLILRADADATITRLLGSPLTLEYPDEGRKLRRTPQIMLVRDGCPWLLDCCWETRASREDVERRSAALGLAVASLGIGYEILTERHFDQAVVRSNVALISRARTDELPEEDCWKSVLALVRTGPITVSDVMVQLSMSIRPICRLILEGWLRVDLEQAMPVAKLGLGLRAPV